MKSTLLLSLIIAVTLTACNESDNADKTESTATITEEVESNTAIVSENLENLEANTTTAAEVIVSDPIIDTDGIKSEMSAAAENAAEVSDSMSNQVKESSQSIAKSASEEAEVIKEKIESAEESVSKDTEIIKENLELIHENEISNTTK